MKPHLTNIALLGGFFFVLILSGCSTLDKKVDGWPQDMKITVHKDAGFWGVQVKCWPDLPWYYKVAGSVAIQCTQVSLPFNTCDIYTWGQDASQHEIDHCKGYDHDGIYQKYFDKWVRVIEDEIKQNSSLRNPLAPDVYERWKLNQRNQNGN